MSEHAVSQLYDALHAFEARRGQGGPYPVHKRLQGVAEDIYDWIIDRVDLGTAHRILDAGCGVGFGTLRLAERSHARVTGISLSERELACARDAAQQRGLASRAEFRRQSFDHLPQAVYDLVVAVESLKHSADLARTLRSVIASLLPGGRLVIVEDLLAGDPRHPSAHELAKDWELAQPLQTPTDYLTALRAPGSALVDLTGHVRRARALPLAVKLATLNVAMVLAAPQRARALRAFRGGLHLERLYADGAMRYAAIFHTANATAPR